MVQRKRNDQGRLVDTGANIPAKSDAFLKKLEYTVPAEATDGLCFAMAVAGAATPGTTPVTEMVEHIQKVATGSAAPSTVGYQEVSQFVKQGSLSVALRFADGQTVYIGPGSKRQDAVWLRLNDTATHVVSARMASKTGDWLEPTATIDTDTGQCRGVLPQIALRGKGGPHPAKARLRRTR
jgi:hypothetical protein